MKRQGFTHVALLLIIVLLVAAAAVAWRTYGQYLRFNSPRKTVVKQVLVRRSKVPKIIIKATTAKVIDVNTGKVITAATVFSVTDKTIYLALDLDKPSVGTRIDYIRYLNNRYVDHGSIKIDRLNTSSVNFAWTVNRLLGSRPDGKYKVATYTNGLLEKRVLYTVEKSTLTGFSIEEGNASDADYYLPLNPLALR